MARISALIRQSSPVCVKYFTSIWIGRPRHLKLAEDAGFDFQHRLREVGRDDLDPPARERGAPNSFTHIAIEYGPCPVKTLRTRSGSIGGRLAP